MIGVIEMKDAIKTLLLISIVIVVWASIGDKAYAKTEEEVVDSLYEQLVVEGKNAAKVVTPCCYDMDEIFADLLKRDDPNTIHDGTILSVRGPSMSIMPNYIPVIEKRDHSYRITIFNGYDLAEADKVVEKAANEILRGLPPGASDQEKLYALSDYIRMHLYYDHRQRHDYTGADKVERKNAIQALMSDDPGTICTGFAAATCLIGQKMGIDIKVTVNEVHAYNMVRFN